MVFSPNVDPKLFDPNRHDSTFSGYADDLVCLLDQLHVNLTIYLGHSMAAMVGCMAAINRPQLFPHLILLSGSPRYNNDEGYQGGFERSQIDAIYRNIDENFLGWVEDFCTESCGSEQYRSSSHIQE
ncbi:hypothetical protein POUND7_001108 [Theobroma cacao]